ncbi:MAG: translational GTPase TypA [Oscillospiraceae bacterium]|nr:translational GTPase TypA [Oscillospiraceae bacterium]MCL2278992.1 translational GTPase TypA [Oscillospiraceae bacterium]
MNLRNIAIIAHVDHGKTTLVDEMLSQAGVFRQNQTVVERIMDSGDLERERGITILAKNTAIRWNDVKINIVDTPGHADFSGEVERILKMVSGVLLLVDAVEGPMPQTRFVLARALELQLKVIVVINKIDKPEARSYQVVDEVLELLMDLDATDEQLDSPIIFCSGRAGTASLAPEDAGSDLTALFNTILSYIPEPEVTKEGPAQLLVSSIDYNEYVGRIGIGRVERGTIRAGQEIIICNKASDSEPYKSKLVNLYEIEDLRRVPAESADAGAIVCFSGVENINIGDTVCDPSRIEALPFARISEPTVEMTFSVNDSPFAGREGKFVTSRNLHDRLQNELLRDVSLRVADTNTTDSWNVAGRGEMHLSILMETMRREGYEFQVSTPRVLFKDIDGVRHEPLECLVCDVPESAVGAVMEKMGQRKGELRHMSPVGNRMRMEFVVPARGLFGYRSEFLTDTHGEGIMSSISEGYVPFKGEVTRRHNGSMVAFESGEAVGYGIHSAQERGILFITPGTPVYAGQVVGQNAKGDDLTVNVCKRKQLTNFRASGSDDSLRLTPAKIMNMEESLEFIADDELLEVTPQSLRLRKRELSHEKRMRKRKTKE